MVTLAIGHGSCSRTPTRGVPLRRILPWSAATSDLTAGVASAHGSDGGRHYSHIQLWGLDIGHRKSPPTRRHRVAAVHHKTSLWHHHRPPYRTLLRRLPHDRFSRYVRMSCCVIYAYNSLFCVTNSIRVFKRVINGLQLRILASLCSTHTLTRVRISRTASTLLSQEPPPSTRQPSPQEESASLTLTAPLTSSSDGSKIS